MSGDTLLKFPCTFPIKMMGATTGAFESVCLAILNRHFPNLTESQVRFKNSKNANYLAITADLWVLSQAQLDALYQELSDHPDVLMVL